MKFLFSFPLLFWGQYQYKSYAVYNGGYSPVGHPVPSHNYGCNGKGITIHHMEIHYSIDPYAFDTFIFSFQFRYTDGGHYVDDWGKDYSFTELGGIKNGTISVKLEVNFAQDGYFSPGKPYQFHVYNVPNKTNVKGSYIIDKHDLGLPEDYDISKIIWITRVELLEIKYSNYCYDIELNKIKKENELKEKIKLLWSSYHSESKNPLKLQILDELKK